MTLAELSACGLEADSSLLNTEALKHSPIGNC